jgi:hypothetical protein
MTLLNLAKRNLINTLEDSMKSIATLTILGFIIGASALPAAAREFTGPKGGTANGATIVVPNRQGGYTGGRVGRAASPNGGTSSSRFRFVTNGQGNANYNGAGTVTNAAGQSSTYTTSGSSSYNRTNGYSGQNTTTINGKTYTSTTQNGMTTIIDSQGNSRTFSRFRR